MLSAGLRYFSPFCFSVYTKYKKYTGIRKFVSVKHCLTQVVKISVKLINY